MIATAPARPLSELDSVPWADLEQAYGDASSIPGHLRALAAGDENARADARYWLSCSIHHQGTLYSATPHAVPFLIGLAAARETAERAWIVRFLADLAVSKPNQRLWTGFDLSLPKYALYFVGAPPEFLASYEAVERGVPVLVELLADADAEVRANAAFTLACFSRRAAEARAAARAALAIEAAPVAQASLMLCLALGDNFLRDASSQPLFAARIDERGQVGLAAAIALCFGSQPGVDADRRAVQAIRAALADAPPPWRELPWNGDEASPFLNGDLATLAVMQLYKQMRRGEADEGELREIYFDLLERPARPSDRRLIEIAAAALQPLVDLVIPPEAPAAPWTLATLPAPLARLAGAIAARPFLGVAGAFDLLAQLQLPGEVGALRRLLEIVDESPLDAVVTLDGRAASVRAWLGAGHPSEALIDAIAAAPAAVAIAIALGSIGGDEVKRLDTATYVLRPASAPPERAVACRLIERAAGVSPARVGEALLAFAREHALAGPPVSYGPGVTTHTGAFTVALRGAAAVAEASGAAPDELFDALLEAEIDRAYAAADLACYLDALPRDRAARFFLDLAARGFRQRHEGGGVVAFDEAALDRARPYLTADEADRLANAVARR